MSRFLAERLQKLAAYVPGEQPKDGEYVKLNTNENPYPPSPSALAVINGGECEKLRLYCDTECTELKAAIAEFYGVSPKNVLPSNGSDEILAFCFQAYGEKGVCFPDITYGFYKVFAELYGESAEIIPLADDFSVRAEDYIKCGKTVFLANPNAQTGRAIDLDDIEKIIAANGERAVVIDEAYVDFGAQSAVGLIEKYDNLIIVQTLSKSRSLAGARIGFAIANESLIADLNRIKYSFNPYNVNRLSNLAGAAAVRDREYFDCTRAAVMRERENLVAELEQRGFQVVPSQANFVLAKCSAVDGDTLYKKLKANGVLVRHFDDERIKDYIRITIGTVEQHGKLFKALDKVIKESI